MSGLGMKNVITYSLNQNLLFLKEIGTTRLQILKPNAFNRHVGLISSDL